MADSLDLFSDFADEGDEEEIPSSSKVSDKALERQFSEGRLRVIQEKNDFFLIHAMDFIRGKKWGNLRPDYQRRLRWDQKKKSRLIESFIMNVPVPPVFLYENLPGKYEVMDGQQRLNTISEFLSNEFELKGLLIWDSLNGRQFSKLPPLIRGSLERAKISAITLVSDPVSHNDPNIDLRAQVFDRLNTGGEKLNHQELRNSLYSGPFNKMIRDLAGNREFTEAWGIPAHSDNINSAGEESENLTNNNLYKRMIDCEIVLRFFAFRDESKVSGSVRSMLDRCMKENRNADDAKIESLGDRFVSSIKLARNIFGENAFRIFENGKATKLSRPLFDAQMIALDKNLAHEARLIERRDMLATKMMELTNPESDSYPLIVGRANTADSIKARIKLMSDIVRDTAQ
ncbi:DUF262 domain-containing protein [Qipengyuania sp. DGS5-3]|uniref:DUF262 domain-containing protein n=1 Tax=Qipengyuania sp. DGS5-3 TaxID=3349632 RepID=UPI0036D38247